MQKQFWLKGAILVGSVAAFSGLIAVAPATANAQKIVVAQAEKPSGEGKVNSVDAAARKVNMTHGPVAALKWPGMTMDFQVAPGTDMSAFTAGANVRFTLKQGADGMYMIDSVQPAK